MPFAYRIHRVRALHAGTPTSSIELKHSRSADCNLWTQIGGCSLDSVHGRVRFAPITSRRAAPRLRPASMRSVTPDRDGNHFAGGGGGSRVAPGGTFGVPRGLARAGVVERLSAVVVRHRRLSRPLVRRLPGAQPLHSVR